MKKTLFFASAAAMMLAACSQDELLTQNQADNAIAFSVNVRNQTRAADSYCANNLPSAFKVWAKKSASGNLYINGDEIARNGNEWVNQTAKRYWPEEALTFYAEVNGDDVFDFNDGAPQFSNFSVKADVADQLDLMYAVNPDVTGDASNPDVALNFRHALSQVCFKAQNETKGLHITINAVGVGGLQGGGTYTLPSTSTEQGYEDHTLTPAAVQDLNRGSWALAGDANKYYQVEGSATVMAPGDDPINISCPADDPHTDATDWSKVMTLMPQTVSAADLASLTQGTDEFPKNAGGYFKVYVTVANVVGDDETVLVSNQPYYVPVDIAWAEGYRYIYTLKFTEDWTPEGLVEIGYSVTVDDFINTNGQTATDPQYWGKDGIQYKTVLMVPAGADPTTEPAIYVLDRNLGAEAVSDFGTWYYWGQTTSDINSMDIQTCGSDYWSDLSHTQWTGEINNGGIQAAYNGGFVTTNDYSTAQLSPGYDAAKLSLGGDWHIPTNAEWQRFIDGTTWEYKYEVDAVYTEFTSKADPDAKVRIVHNGKWNGSKWVSSGNVYTGLWSATPKEGELATDYFRSAYYFYQYNNSNGGAPHITSSNFNIPHPIRPFSATGTLS